ELLGWLLRRPVRRSRYRVRSRRPLCNIDLGAAARLGWSPRIGSTLGMALPGGDAPPGADAGGVLATPRSGGGIESDTSAGCGSRAVHGMAAPRACARSHGHSGGGADASRTAGIG